MEIKQPKTPATQAKSKDPFFGNKGGAAFFGPQESDENFFNGSVLRRCAACEEKETLQKKQDTGSSQMAPPHIENSLNASRGAGSPLPGQTRDLMESSFGTDLGKVRIHDNSRAAAMSSQLNAHAFTHGNDIYFNRGKYNTNSQEGHRLLAHELTHTIQQSGEYSGKAIQRDDASFEAGNMGTAITSGTMTQDALMGKTFYAENCRGIFGCRVGFTFDKAYKGTFAYGSATKNVKGVYVKISSAYDHSICGNCDSIRLIQTVRNITKNASGDMVVADPEDPTRRERSGWDDPFASSKGWRIDTLTNLTDPFYDYTAGYDSQVGSPTKSAILWDSPGGWETDTNAGKEFQTFFVCEAAGGKKKTIAGINWGYYIDSSGAISFRPATPMPFCGPTEVLKDSAERWDDIDGNTEVGIDFAPENPVDHEGERTMVWFNFDSDQLRNDATIQSDVHYHIALQRIREHIMANLFLSKIIIRGFASADGDPKHNFELSRHRCEAIKTRLIADGIPPFMIEIEPHGVNTELTPPALNRRVEIETTNVIKGVPSLLNNFLSPLKNIFK